ncbi:MAG: PDZ domain-containing protein, partial [Gemmatimonadota bacterium]|nr:PDZ domain-containing protein [Gemmatimonadota bacterium]
IDRAQREITLLSRQLASTSTELDSASVRQINERMQRAVEQLTRAQASQEAQLARTTVRRPRTPVAVAPRANAWMTQAMDGYIGVLWSASVDVERRKEGDALWTFHDYPQVEAVERESPAEQAGILVGDVITAFDGKDLRSGKIVLNSVLRPGSTVQVKLLREKRPRSVSVRVASRPRSVFRTPAPEAPVVVDVPFDFELRAPQPAEPAEAPPRIPRGEAPYAVVTPTPLGVPGGATVGAAMIPLDRTLGEPYGTDYGLLVVQVGPQTPAARAGIQRGDVLIAVNGRELQSVGQLVRAVQRAQNDELRIELLRKKVKRTVVMTW